MSALPAPTFRGFTIGSLRRSGEFVAMKNGEIIHRERTENALYATIENATRRKGRAA